MIYVLEQLMVHLFDMLRISMRYLSNLCQIRDATNLNMKGIRFFLLTLYIVYKKKSSKFKLVIIIVISLF